MTRTWAGTTLDDRKAARRAQLLAAGLGLLGTGGSSAVSVRAVCRHAKLTERYFYENFADREQLVVAVYEDVAEQLRRALIAAVPDTRAQPAARAEAAVTAFVELMVDDPRKGRVLLLAPVTDPALSARGVALLPAFAALVREQLPERMAADEREMTALGLVGALANLFTGYLGGTLRVTRDRLIAHCVHLLAHAAS
ncbi:TetR family transcriptional regulator [Amycolatopsis acidiphila]|uniref:TetR/AcrR family transcriptional regulator n=1 Tax=Amycolatopsis acidiphila TaxID=715473 RepID=A0A558AKM6_9PSEU|nr:TetR family transcriptional regulator [Amycolatopsis acidiphila]TVT24825.1 TetR/AcrR family transcriptional regulator [Amycolatopsis acidiphila]UIJ62807.1 TetR family transcriptional regulator [Amycolatopsis acidiphila]GHG64319.1 TetR family transcriptional regulator [Amycolatopsis acidiphila]